MHIETVFTKHHFYQVLFGIFFFSIFFASHRYDAGSGDATISEEIKIITESACLLNATLKETEAALRRGYKLRLGEKIFLLYYCVRKTLHSQKNERVLQRNKLNSNSITSRVFYNYCFTKFVYRKLLINMLWPNDETVYISL